MDYIFDPAPTPTVAVFGRTARFPVRRIFCIGRNYEAHAREMGMDPERESPLFFLKPADVVVDDHTTIPYPPQTENLHYEAEMVVAIGTGGRDITIDHALEHVWGYGVGNDLTRRDLQAQARDMGRPWDLAKGFDRSAPISPIRPVSEVGHPESGMIRLSVNGALKQEANLSEMIWTVPEMISILSQSMELKAGDLIMTGTPAGVGPLVPGDTCIASVEGLGELTTTIGPRP